MSFSTQTESGRSSPTASKSPERRNVVIFGDVGVGKSSLVNLICGKDVATTLGWAKSFTFRSQEYTVALDEVNYSLYDTAGLHEAQANMRKAEYLDPVARAYALISRLERSGGISLLVFCIKGGRVSIKVQQTCNLFVDIFCGHQVPVVIVVTHLEMYERTEDWWDENERTLKEYGLHSHGHACITTTRGYKQIFTDKYEESRRVMRNLLRDYTGRVISKEKTRWVKQAVYTIRLGKQSHDVLRKKLIKRCGFSPADAEEVAKTIEELAPSEEVELGFEESQIDRSNARIADLERVDQNPLSKLSESRRTPVDNHKTINSLRAELRAQRASSDTEIQDLRKQLDTFRRELDKANDQIVQTHDLRDQLATSRQEQDRLKDLLRLREETTNKEISYLKRTADRLNRIIHIHKQKHQCEALFDQGRVLDAAKSSLEIETSLSGDATGDRFLSEWLSEFTARCIKTLERSGDEASTAEKRDEAIAAYAAVLSLSPLASVTVLMKWARIILIGRTAGEVLSATAKFKPPKFIIYHTICDILEGDGRLKEAVECFHRMRDDLSENMTDDKRVKWERGFREQCISRLVKLGDAARDARKHGEAVQYYSDAISLEPTALDEIQLKYSNEIILFDPSSYEGYQKKHAALNGMGRYSEAFEAFQLMLAKVNRSRDPCIQELRFEYLDITPLIKQEVQKVVGPMPRLLIDTKTGRLYDKVEQAAAFEGLPIFHELRSSMTTRSQLNLARIQDGVKSFYRYVMFSHRWELHGEPVLHDVQKATVYVLEATSPNIKLQTLCKIVRGLGFTWVWSDTCCIDKDNNVVLQESLVAMFSWYRGSALTLIHLRGVLSDSQQPGDLRRSVWNSRVWTYQEYLAAETVRFYTEDWKPYLGLDIPNHKASSDIISEMEPELGVSAPLLTRLQPGLDRVREKLSLASTRETTFPEDIAYSLLGIFNASIPIIYGERYRAVGRLLEHVLTGSGDMSILAWTGNAGVYNSCLPLDLSVYSQVIPPHIPQPIETGVMDRKVEHLRSSSQLDHTLLGTLYHRLCYLPTPSMASHRLRLSGIVFQIRELVCTSEPDPETKIYVYRTATSTLGDIEIRSAEKLSGMKNLCLVHPWIRPLLDQEFAEDVAELDKTTRALRFLVRLGQPFGALLFHQLSFMEYKRVAVDSLIMVQIREEMSLAELLDNVSTIEVQ